jgi:multidrug efflux pump subunit AcrA (membrane-fusion protein)
MSGPHDSQRLTLTDRTRAMVTGTNVVPAAVAGFLLCLLIGGFVVFRTRTRTPAAVTQSDVKPGEAQVDVVRAIGAIYSNTRRYVGNLEPWAKATIGPKTLSAYVANVSVRPGDSVAKGDVLATLDCRTALALVPQRVAEDGTVQPQRGVGDCTFKAPFDGEVSSRTADPGAFVSPGMTILTIIDRSTIRMVLKVPESDFAFVKAGTNVTIRSLATGSARESQITRRAPEVDPATHTVDVEIDITDDDKGLPLGTSAEVVTVLGEPQNATEIPSGAAKLRGDIATVMVVDGDTVSRVRVKALGEHDGKLYVDPSLAPGSQVVLEGPKPLRDGDRITIRQTD